MAATSAFESSPEMERFLCERLLDAEQPIAERFRALFSLRNLRGDAPRRTLLQGIASLHLIALATLQSLVEGFSSLWIGLSNRCNRFLVPVAFPN